MSDLLDDDGHDKDLRRMRMRVHDLADAQHGLVAGQHLLLEKMNTIMVRIDSNVEQRNRMEHMLDEVRGLMHVIDDRQDKSERTVSQLQSDLRISMMKLEAMQREVAEFKDGFTGQVADLKNGFTGLTNEVKRIESGSPNVSAMSTKKKAGLWTIGITFLLGAVEFMHEFVLFLRALAAKFNLKI